MLILFCAVCRGVVVGGRKWTFGEVETGCGGRRLMRPCPVRNGAWIGSSRRGVEEGGDRD